MRFSDTVKRVIALATAIRGYWDTELPKRHPKYPLVQPGEDDGPPPPEEAQLRQLLNSLPPDEMYKLLALADVGRGLQATAFEQRWREYIKDAPELLWAIEYQIGTPPLADYLAEGVERLREAGINLDTPQPSAV